MLQIGYKLSSEEFGPNDLVRHAARAEEAGFTFALISDHYHPWIDKQGQSPFVWCVIGGVAEATSKLRLGTGVTCPTVRIHPAIVAQAAATAAAMMEGRFFLGVGTGENLNEHVVGRGWPETAVRQERLAEAIEVLRLQTHPAWLDHVTSDRFLSPSEFRHRYGDIFPGGRFTDLYRSCVLTWQDQVDPNYGGDADATPW